MQIISLKDETPKGSDNIIALDLNNMFAMKLGVNNNIKKWDLSKSDFTHFVKIK